jgi:hypothetical protein
MASEPRLRHAPLLYEPLHFAFIDYTPFALGISFGKELIVALLISFIRLTIYPAIA